MSEQLNYSGQYVIDNLDWIQPSGLAINILEHYAQITVYEDMFAPFMSGNILMNDTIDIPNLYMNSGADVLRLRIRTPGLSEKYAIDRTFHIYKIDERTEVSDRTLQYLIHFVSSENLMDQGTKISKTFKGNCAEIANTIAKQYLQTDRPLVCDESSNVIQYTSNYWAPTKNLNYVAERAVGKYKLPTFMFFENRDGFNLTDVAKFADKTHSILQAWSVSDYVADVSKNGQIIRNPARDYQSVQAMDVKVNFDYMKDAKNGLMKTRLFTYDFVTGTFKDRTASIADSDIPLLASQRFYEPATIDTAGSAHLTGYSHYNLYNGSGNTANAVDWLHKRNVIMRSIQQHKVEITVYGRTDYTVGKKANFSTNKMRAFQGDAEANSITDNLFSGDYIISAVRHRFQRDNFHECKIELTRDSIQKQS